MSSGKTAMRNANSSTDQADKILRTIEVRFLSHGKVAICSMDGWLLPDDETLTYCQIWSRERYRIKVAIYGRELVNPEALAATLCKSWFDSQEDGGFWRRVDLNA